MSSAVDPPGAIGWPAPVRAALALGVVVWAAGLWSTIELSWIPAAALLGVAGVVVLLRPRDAAPPATARAAAIAAAACLVPATTELAGGVAAHVVAGLWLVAAAWMCWGASFVRSRRVSFAAALSTTLMSPSITARHDPWIDALTARAAAALLRFSGVEAQVDGATIVGVGASVHVTPNCAGVFVSVGAFVVGALVCDLAVPDVRRRLPLVAGFVVLVTIFNAARVFVVGFVVSVFGLARAAAMHDGVGVAFAVASYALLAFAVRLGYFREHARLDADVVHAAGRPP